MPTNDTKVHELVRASPDLDLDNDHAGDVGQVRSTQPTVPSLIVSTISRPNRVNLITAARPAGIPILNHYSRNYSIISTA